MKKRKFWQKPDLHFEEDMNQHRKVTWLELFFDLYFVVVIAAVAHNLSAEMDMAGLGTFILTFIPIWWVWIGITYYNERFETEGFENRLFTFLLMIPVAGLAIYSHHALTDNFPGFALSYVAARLIIISLWIYASYHNKAFRPAGKRLIIGFSASIIIVFLSIFLFPPLHWIAFGVALTIDLITPLFTPIVSKELPKFSTSKLPERFGLFTIVVLGESIVGTINGIRQYHHPGLEEWLFGIMGLAIAFGLWWIYFDFIGRRVADNNSKAKQFLWSYLHMPLVMAIVIVGSALVNVVGETGELTHTGKEFLLIGAGAFLFSTGLLEMTLKPTDHEPTHPMISPVLKMVLGVALAFVGFFVVHGLSSNAVLLIIIACQGVVMIYGLYVWFSQDITHIEEPDHFPY